MKRAVLLSWLCLGALVFGCNTADPGAGSNTNWLRPCEEHSECGDELGCWCGVCTEPCGDGCELRGGVCALPGSGAHSALCASDAADPGVGLCLPSCAVDAQCSADQLCHEGGCLSPAGVDAPGSACVAGAQLELSTEGLELAARHGTLFGDALYLPVEYAERPADWVEPMTPLPIVARVTDQHGAPLEGCSVAFLVSDGGGSAFADGQSTNAAGEVTTYWVAGAARLQTLTAALVDEDGQLASARLEGIGYANDEGPQAADAASTSARPATVRLGYALPEAAGTMRVRLSAATFPHHAFYAALYSEGFFAGLQNTSDFDALNGSVPDDERILIASVWHLEGADAELLYQRDDLSCEPHFQELGGIRCIGGAAWQRGQDYVFTLERSSLLQGEAGAGYAELGYATTPCASPEGCTDYTLYFAGASEPDVMQRVVAYRYQSAAIATGFGSFVQPYVELAEQHSCLATPRYDASFTPLVLVDGAFEPVTEASFSATYQTWKNEVCANYDAGTQGGFQLITGGPRVLGRPTLPGDPERILSLP